MTNQTTENSFLCRILQSGKEVNVTMRRMTPDEFEPLWTEWVNIVFSEKTRFDPRTVMTPDEIAARRSLHGNMGKPLTLHYGVFIENRFIGWHVGDQKSAEEFYMRNTGILPDFQGHGIYKAMLKKIVADITAKGFQIISSKHNATNNRVIIPKLKAGFTITGLELSDKFGTLVRLEYFTNAQRRAIMDFRCGQSDAPAGLL